MKKKDGCGLSRRSFIKMSSGAIMAVSANWFMPRMSRAAEDEIRLGAVCELSGAGSTVSSEQAQGIEMAVEMYNQKGGILGKKIKLIMEDSETKKDVGLAKTRKLVERDKIHFFTGITNSAISMGIQPYLWEKKMLFVNSGSASDAVTEPPYCNRYFFKITNSMKCFAMAVREPARRLGPKWYFIGDNYSFGKLCVGYAKQAIALVKPNFEIVGEEYTNLGETNYAPYITKVMAAKPDGLFLDNYGIGYTRIIKAAREMGVKAHIHHLFFSYVDAKATGDAVLGITGGTDIIHNNPNVPRFDQFLGEFQKKYNNYPFMPATYSLTGVEALFEAVKAAGTLETEAVIDKMETMTYPNSVMGKTFHFRKSDHVAISPVYTVEVIKDPKYQYTGKILEYDANPTAILAPEGQTGCEAAMKKG